MNAFRVCVMNTPNTQIVIDNSFLSCEEHQVGL